MSVMMVLEDHGERIKQLTKDVEYLLRLETPLGTGDSDYPYTVLVSVDDTTPGYLEQKIVAGDNVSVAVVNGGANETVEVSADVGLDDLHDPVTLTAAADVLLEIPAGTQEIDLDTQAANTALMGPSTGPDAAPTFRAIATDDLPDLPAPGTVSVSTTNDGSAPHTHEVESSSAVTTATAVLLATDDDGYLQIVRLGVGVSPGYPLHVVSTANSEAFYVVANSVTNGVAFTVEAPLSTDPLTGKAFQVKINGESFGRVMFYTDGKLGVGDGTAVRDTFLSRNSANRWLVSSDGDTGVGHVDLNPGGEVDGVDVSVFADAQFLMLATNAETDNERVLVINNGLTASDGGVGGNYTVDLGTPDSLTATSTNAVTADSHTHQIDASIARSAITISAGNGLTGGGDLTTNRTIALGTPGSSTSTSGNAVTTTSHTHAIDGTIARSAITISAGNGLTGGGDLTTNRTIALGTPSTLTTGTGNSVTGTSHTHTIATTTTGAASTIVATDANGRTQLDGLGIGAAPLGDGILRVTNRIFINETSISGISTAPALIINQGEIDVPIIILKNSDVAHGMTGTAETDTFGQLGPVSTSGQGGLSVEGFNENITGLQLVGAGVNVDTGKATTSVGQVIVSARQRFGGGPGTTTLSTNGNLFVVRNFSTTRWIVDAEGDTHRDGSENTFDTYHDAQLARTFDRVVSPRSVIDSEFDEWVQYGRDDLITAGIMHESGFYNESRLLRLLTGDAWQGYVRDMELRRENKRLTRRVEALERKLINGT